MKVIKDNETECWLLPEGVSMNIGGLMYACKVSELINILEALKIKYGDKKIGLYDSFEQGTHLMLDDDDKNIVIFMSNLN